MKTGLVVAIDRATSTVDALMYPFFAGMDPPPMPIKAGFRGSPPPTPFCPANFSDDLRQCLGSVTPAVRLLHEEWMSLTVETGPPVKLEGDTEWFQSEVGTCQRNHIATGMGVYEMRCTSNGVNDGATLVKGASGANTLLMSAADGWWISTKFGIFGITNNFASLVTFARNSGYANAGLGWSYSLGANWQLIGADNSGGGGGTVDSGVPVVADQLYQFDVFFVPGGFVAGWIDGKFIGSLDLRSEVPDPTDVVQPYIFAQRQNAAGSVNIGFKVDTVDFYVVANAGIPHPSIVPI